MAEVLEKFFYDVDNGFMPLFRLIEIGAKHKIAESDVKEWYHNQKVNQIMNIPKSIMFHKIHAPPNSFMIDIVFFPKDGRVKIKILIKRNISPKQKR